MKKTMKSAVMTLAVIGALGVTPTAFGAIMCANLTSAGASAQCAGAFFVQMPQQSTGTGVFPSFIQVSQSNGQDAIEQSYSSDNLTGANNESGSSAQHNHSIFLNVVPIYAPGTTVDGFLLPASAGNIYLRFTLDVNESSGNLAQFLSLDQLQLSTASTGTLHPDIAVNGSDIPTAPSLGTSVFNLDSASDNWIALDYSLNSGSGSGDMWAYIPMSISAYNACITANCYAYLYSAFGFQGTVPAGTGVPAGEYGPSGGFEEWAFPGTSNVSTVPEPLSLSLVGGGLLALGLFRKRFVA